MNAMVRMLLPLGLVGFGAVAAYMGAVVLATCLGSGQITTGVAAGDGGPAVTRTLSRVADPDAYWRAVLLLGALPAVGGLVSAVLGWRMLTR